MEQNKSVKVFTLHFMKLRPLLQLFVFNLFVEGHIALQKNYLIWCSDSSVTDTNCVRLFKIS